MAAKMMNSASHMRLYKKTSQDVQQMRTLRHEKRTELRKDKRTQQFLKKRDVHVRGEEPEDLAGVMPDAQSTSAFMNDVLSRLYAANDTETKLVLAKDIRFLLHHKPGDSRDDILNSGAYQYFVEFLKNNDCCELQYEAACILGFIATGNATHHQAVVTSNAIPNITRLLGSQNEDVQEIAVYVLGRIASVSPQSRTCVIKEGIFKPLLYMLNKTANISIIRNASSCASVLCDGELNDNSVLPVLSQLLQHDDSEVLVATCLALRCVIKGRKDMIQNVIDHNFCPRVVHLLMHSRDDVVSAAICVIREILSGTNTYVQVILDSAFLPCVVHVLSNKNTPEDTREMACWIISDITNGTSLQLQQVREANIFPMLDEILYSGTLTTWHAVVRAYKNAIFGRAREVVHAVVATGCIEPLCSMLNVPDADIVDAALDTLYSILLAGEKDAKSCGSSNVYADTVESCLGLKKIEKLQDHENEEIFQKADYMVDKFFSDLDEKKVNESAEQLQFNDTSNCYTQGFQF